MDLSIQGSEVADLGDKQGTIRQILVVTDGCSNIGDDPIVCAAKARKDNIVVNVIGVVDAGDIGKHGKSEALSIAEAGGGMCRLVQSVQLSATAQMMTHQTMQMTLQQVINQELLQVMGKSTDDLPPVERARVMQIVDKLEEEVRLEVVVAVDTSASMKDKMVTVREAIRDLALSLQARQGESVVAVVSFPGPKEDLVKVVQPFSKDVDVTSLEQMFVARGGTPTGPAIDYAIRMFQDIRTTDDVDDFPSHRWTGESASS
jgi:Ca-activated chloride channel family protein